jgi:hypothetical protein
MEANQLAILWLIMGTLALFTMIFGIRYLRNRENLAMIEKGMDPKLNTNRPAPYKNLKWGLLLIGAGVGLLAAYILSHLIVQPDKWGNYDGERVAPLYFALIAIGGGLGLVGSYRVEKKEVLDKKNAE